MREGRSRATTTALVVLIGYVSAIAVLYTTALPRHFLAALIIGADWVCCASIWIRSKSPSERWRAVFLAGLGGLLALMTWRSPEPPPVSPLAALGLLTGGVLGALLIWRIYLRTDL